MSYRKFRADYVFDGYAFLPEGTVLVTDTEGTITGQVSTEEAGDGVEVLTGILAPGFINCHCHIELSHMKDVIPPHTGLVDFLISVVTRRGMQSEPEIREQVAAAAKEMEAGGIAGVLDICNTDGAIAAKAQSRLRWHNAVEVLNLYDAGLSEKLRHYGAVLERHRQLNAASVLTPHAPYTVSMATYAALNAQTAGCVISIHNQEAAAENELFQSGRGDFLRLFSALGIPRSPFGISGKTSLQTWLPYFTNRQTLLLVHNTFITEEDIIFARQHAAKHGLRIVYCLCPNANRYIEQALPPVDLLLRQGAEVVLGTDSYCSNRQLSIAAEVQTLQNHFPFLPLETLLQWATSGGAGALGWNDLGTLRAGTRPGLVQLDTIPGRDRVLTGAARRIV